MSKIKTYLIIAAFLFLAAAVITVNVQAKKLIKLRADNFRLEGNQFSLMSDARQQTNLYLKEHEVTGRLKRSRDSLAAALKVKPKQIEKIVYIDNSTHDTIPKEVPVYMTGTGGWKITDGNDCFKWSANAFLRGDSLKVERILFENNNRITQTFYRKRPYRFLFIKYGKWNYLQKISSTCGSSTIETFNFSK